MNAEAADDFKKGSWAKKAKETTASYAKWNDVGLNIYNLSILFRVEWEDTRKAWD